MREHLDIVLCVVFGILAFCFMVMGFLNNSSLYGAILIICGITLVISCFTMFLVWKERD